MKQQPQQVGRAELLLYCPTPQPIQLGRRITWWRRVDSYARRCDNENERPNKAGNHVFGKTRVHLTSSRKYTASNPTKMPPDFGGHEKVKSVSWGHVRLMWANKCPFLDDIFLLKRTTSTKYIGGVAKMAFNHLLLPAYRGFAIKAGTIRCLYFLSS